MKKKIRLAIVGVGNCACSLIQGFSYYTNKNKLGSSILNWDVGGYTPVDMEVVSAFDVDKRKVGKSLKEAIFSQPNNTKVFYKTITENGINVKMGKILDGVSNHFKEFSEKESIIPSSVKESSKTDIVNILKENKADVLVNFLPVGSEKATAFYMECALEAKVGVVNCIPCFIASDKTWNDKFKSRKVPIIGDDIKSQMGATIIHRALTRLFESRGVVLDETYQLNFGGNTDFLNMLERSRLKSKKISKTEAVTSNIKKHKISKDRIHIGPSDYVPFLKDNKICMIYMQGRMFGDMPFNIELKLSVEDSPNSAGIVIEAIRCCKLALNINKGGAIEGPSAFFMKHPPKQYPDDIAKNMLDNFILEYNNAYKKSAF